MIYIKSLRHLLADLAHHARAFAEDYNRVGYEVASVEADPTWPWSSIVATRVGMAADLRWDLGLADGDFTLWLYEHRAWAAAGRPMRQVAK